MKEGGGRARGRAEIACAAAHSPRAPGKRGRPRPGAAPLFPRPLAYLDRDFCPERGCGPRSPLSAPPIGALLGERLVRGPRRRATVESAGAASPPGSAHPLTRLLPSHRNGLLLQPGVHHVRPPPHRLIFRERRRRRPPAGRRERHWRRRRRRRAARGRAGAVDLGLRPGRGRARRGGRPRLVLARPGRLGRRQPSPPRRRRRRPAPRPPPPPHYHLDPRPPPAGGRARDTCPACGRRPPARRLLRLPLLPGSRRGAGCAGRPAGDRVPAG